MHRSAPFASLRVMLRVAIKALCILAAANIIFLALGVDPLQKLIDFNLWGLVGQGRARLIYPSDLINGELPVEAQLAAHAIAYTPKTPDEYRVVLLGDSGIAGWGLSDEDTLSAQLTARHLMRGNQHVVVYNLAYPYPSAPKDVVIIDALKPYQPDLIVWFVTLSSVENAVQGEESFLEVNRDRLVNIASGAGLQDWVDKYVSTYATWPSWSAIRHPDLFSPWLKSLTYPFFPPSIGFNPVRADKRTIPALAELRTGQPEVTPLLGETWQFLQVGRTLAGGADVLLVNEALFVGSGVNSDINYNLRYERKAYDDYHAAMNDYAKRYNFWVLDIWNAVSPEHFTDSELHMDRQGWSIVADHLADELSKVKGIHG